MQRKSIYSLACIMLFALSGSNTFAQNTVTTPRAASPAAEVSQTIGISKVNINYSWPSVKDREGKFGGS